MKTTFEKATEASRKGYISDQDSIDWIVQNFASVPLRTFRNDRTQFVIDLLKDFMRDSGMDDNKIYQVMFGEVLGMIELMVTSGIYQCDGEKFNNDLRFTMLAHIRNMLIDFDCKNNAVHLFMSITVKEYFRYLNLRGKVSVRKSLRNFSQNVHKHMYFEITAETKVGQLLSTIANFQSRNWVPTMTMTQFEEYQRNIYDDLYCLLIKHFKQAFPHYFDLNTLKEKYKKEF